MAKSLLRYVAAGVRDAGGVVIEVTLTYEDGSTVTYTRAENVDDGTVEVSRTEPDA